MFERAALALCLTLPATRGFSADPNVVDVTTWRWNVSAILRAQHDDEINSPSKDARLRQGSFGQQYERYLPNGVRDTAALALDPNWTWPHEVKGGILRAQGRAEEAVAEHERALALDPSNVSAATSLGFDYGMHGEFDKSVEYIDKAIRESPYDPLLVHLYGGKAWANFGLKNYDQAIEWARQAIAVNPNYVHYIHTTLVAALALAGHDAEARDALKRYLALPSTGPLKTIAALKAYYSPQGGGPARVEANERVYDGLRKAGLPEK